jgi:hypothetical protein
LRNGLVPVKPTLVRIVGWSYLLAILVVAVWRTLATANDWLFGDEWRYLWYAKNLTRGYFSPADSAVLLNGPGYPLLLVPFVAAGAPTILPKLLNAVLFALAIFYVDRTLRLYTSPLRATLGGVALLVSPLPWRYLQLLYTETVSLFLVAGLFFHFCRASKGPRARLHLFCASLFLAALVMTKVSFAGAMIGSLVTLGGLILFGKRGAAMKRACLVTVSAFALCIPWLVYTHHISGRWFYWTSGIGQQAYWLSTPFPDELGDWFHQGHVENLPLLRLHHGAVYQRLRGDPAATAGTELDRIIPGLGKLYTVEADAKFMQLALANIRSHPTSYLRNWVFNVSRLIFDCPYTFNYDIDMRLALPHLAVVAAVLAVCVQWIRRRLVMPCEVAMIALFTLLAMASWTLVSAHGRFFLPLLPGCIVFAIVGTAPSTRKTDAAPTDRRLLNARI